MNYVYLSDIMIEFRAFSENVEVFGQTILCFVYGIPLYENEMRELLNRHGLTDVQADRWYSQQKWLNAFAEVSEDFGPNTLFTLGKSIPEQAAFRGEFTELKEALDAVDSVFKMNHRNGNAGNYKLVMYDAENKQAIMESDSSYPMDFERGVLVGMIRKYKPVAGSVPRVETITTSDNSGKSFLVKW